MLSNDEKPKASLADFIGKTPLIALKSTFFKISPQIEIYVKAEWLNPGGSIKDRPALRMVAQAQKRGLLKKGITLIDSTSGNTGIAYAMLGAAMEFPVELVIPTNVSFERKRILQSYGAKLTFSDPLKGSDGARESVKEIVKSNPGRYFFADQYNNPDNWRSHYETTGPEIWEQTKGRITHFFCGLGTSGTMMGVSRYLKEKNRAVKTIAIEPEPFHGIEGLKHMESALPVGIYEPARHDEKITIGTESAYTRTRDLVQQQGILAGPSSGAVLHGALDVLSELKEAVAVLIFADSGDKYLSTQLWQS